MSEVSKYWDKTHLQYNSSYDNWLNKYTDLFDNNSRIIELGCGRAYCSKYLIDNGYNDIVACDISNAVLKIVNESMPELKTLLFDMSDGLPFDDNSKDVFIADLCLHYFDLKTTKFIFEEIKRVLVDGGLLIARVNATNDKLHIPDNSILIEKNLYYDGNIYKRFFEERDFKTFFEGFDVLSLRQDNMSRYDNPKVLWEFCIKKKK